jgi:hypothetical protein
MHSRYFDSIIQEPSSSMQVNKHHTSDCTVFVLLKEWVAYYDHRHRGIYETNILRTVKQAEGETTVSNARLCSTMSWMTRGCPRTSFLHCCWIPTGSLFGLKAGHGLTWDARPVTHTHTHTTVSQPRIQTIYWPLVWHISPHATLSPKCNLWFLYCT